MKKIILAITLVVMGVPLAGAAWMDADTAVNAALDRLSGAQEAPRWKSSLGGIENAIAVLVEANRRLFQEYQSLSARRAALEAEIMAQRRGNSAREAALAERREKINTPAASSVEKQKLAQLEKDTRQARLAAGAAQARLKAVDSKLALRKLKIQALEIEKKSLLMDRDARTVSTLGLLKQSVASLKERSDSQRAQMDFVQQKIKSLGSVDRPYLKEAGQLAADNNRLKGELAALTAQRAELLKQVDTAVEKKNQSGLSPEARRLQDMAARKAALEVRVAAAQVKKDKLGSIAAAHAVSAAALAAQIKGLEGENKDLEEATGNVRENIAVLEYRMNSLLRYKNRNAKQD